MILKDPLYGFISIPEPFERLVNSVPFQRLRNIKQLGKNYLIYPSANHSRFEHSVGAYYLATKFAEINRIERKNEFIAAALLHDLGHYPFSHAIEDSVALANGFNHEEQTLNLIRGYEISKIIKNARMNVNRVCDLIQGRGKFGKLISGQIDVDRLDYLKRDSYYTGVAYGVIETDVIIKNLSISGKNYLAGIKYLPALESILISRYLMYAMVYMHHKTVIANTMLRAAFISASEAKEISAGDLIKFDDIDLISRLRNSKTPAARLIGCLDRREFYEEAIVFRKPDFSDLNKLIGPQDVPKTERIIAKELKLKNYELLINILRFPASKDSKIIIDIGSGKKQPLEKISPLLNALSAAEWNHWFIGVYCPKKHLKRVISAKNAIKKHLLKGL